MNSEIFDKNVRFLFANKQYISSEQVKSRCFVLSLPVQLAGKLIRSLSGFDKDFGVLMGCIDRMCAHVGANYYS